MRRMQGNSRATSMFCDSKATLFTPFAGGSKLEGVNHQIDWLQICCQNHDKQFKIVSLCFWLVEVRI